MTDIPINLCSVCYIEKGIILSSCGCFICSRCLQSINKSDPRCPQCGKAIDYKKILDLRVKENIKKIDFIFDEPELHLKKIIESIKFQKMHQKKYISFLQNKIDILMKENSTLKELLKTSTSFYGNSRNNVSQHMSYCNTRDMNIDMSPIPSNMIDMSKIKKIEPKRGTVNQSNKLLGSAYTPININNLNARTASGQFSNNPGKGLLNVNINNNSNKLNVSPYMNKNSYQASQNEAVYMKKR